MDNFRMPSESSRLTSLGSGSDEESFVVLGKSLCDVDRSSPGERTSVPPFGLSITEEPKRLIKEELKVIDEKMSGGSAQTQTVNPKDDSVDGVNVMLNSSRSVTENKGGVNLKINTEPLQNLQIAGAATGAGSSRIFMDTKEQFPSMSTSEHNSAITNASDLASEQVQDKITQIIDENINLKDTILRNNQILEAQYERIVAWQEEIQKVHQSHNDKIYETEAVIDQLKKENDLKNVEIKRMLQHLDNKDKEIETLNSKMIAMKTELDEKLTERTEYNLKQFELERAGNKIRELEKELQKMSENLISGSKEKNAYTKRIHELQEQLNCSNNKHGELKKENDLKNVEIKRMIKHLDNKDKEIETLNKKMTAMKIKWDEKLTERTEANLKEFELEAAENKIRELKRELQNMTENMNSGSKEKNVYTQRIHELQEQLNYSKNKHEELKIENGLKNVEIKRMIEHMDNRDKEIETLNKKMTGMKIELDQKLVERTESYLKQFELGTAINQIRELEKELQNMTDSLNSRSREKNAYAKRILELQEQLNCSKNKREELETELAKMKYTISDRETGLTMEKNSIRNHHINTTQHQASVDGEIFALQAQLELYKADFEAEHSANQILRDEKGKVLEDLQTLQRRNQQLQEEIDLLRPENKGGLFYRRPARSSTSSTTPSATYDLSLQCPKCKFGFMDLKSLEDHVYRCIEIDESLP